MSASALREHIEDASTSSSQKYFEGTVHAHVTVEKQRGNFHTDCTLHLATGLVLQADGDGRRGPSQLRRRGQSPRKAAAPLQAAAEGSSQVAARTGAPAAKPQSYVITPAPEEEDEAAGLNPVVVAEADARLPELSVGEAVMQLDISNVPFVLFRNGGHGRLNVVYRRKDGNIGWVDPKPAA